MVDAMRAMLDELMGKERDLPPEERTGKGITYKDAHICKYALAGLCPYGLFKNTKSDLGLCKYEVHEDDVEFDPAKEEWDKLADIEKERYGYRKELLELLTQLVRDMDRKIERQKDRAAKESEARVPTPPERSQLEEFKSCGTTGEVAPSVPKRGTQKDTLLSTQTKEKDALKLSEESAEAGNVDASLMYASQAEGWKKKHDELYKQVTTPERTMTVCDVCGVFINSTDNDQRKADHLAGKQYLGWLAIREKLAEVQKDAEQRANSRSERPRDHGKERHRERDSRRYSEAAKDSHRSEAARDSHRSEAARDSHRNSRSERHRSDRERRRSRSRDRLRGAEIPPPPEHLYGRGNSRHSREERSFHR